MQGADLIGPLVEQPRPQDVAEEVVVAVPLPPVVERDQEEVGPLEGFQPRGAALLAGDGVAQRAAQPREDSGL